MYCQSNVVTGGVGYGIDDMFNVGVSSCSQPTA